MKLNNFLLCVALLLPISLLADVTLSNETYNNILLRLKKDKQLIETEQIRWNNLKTAKPIINYKVENNIIVIQTIEIPIHKSKSLIYEVKFEVTPPVEASKIFPMQLFLSAALETSGLDAKFGIQVFNVEKIVNYPIGINFMIGGKSFGGSFSYSLPKPLDNTMIHLYIGETYSLTTSFGIGVSLNF